MLQNDSEATPKDPDSLSKSIFIGFKWGLFHCLYYKLKATEIQITQCSITKLNRDINGDIRTFI